MISIFLMTSLDCIDKYKQANTMYAIKMTTRNGTFNAEKSTLLIAQYAP